MKKIGVEARTRTGYDAVRVVLCVCGWGGRFAGLRAANAAIAQHLDTACEGCDHAVHMEESDAREATRRADR